MRASHFRITTVPALIIVALLSVAGCASAGAGSEADAAGAVTAETTSPPVPEAAEPESAAEEEDAVTDAAACLVGDWLADNDFFLTTLREFGDEPTSVTGEVTLTFTADGAVSTRYDQWRITMIVEGSEAVITRDGVDHGVYAAEDTTVTLQEQAMGSSLLLSTAGMDMPFAPDAVSYTDAQYTCSSADAEISTSDGRVILTRIGG